MCMNPTLTEDNYFTVCKIREGRPGLVYHMSDINVYVGRQKGEEGGVQISSKHFLMVSVQVLGFHTLAKWYILFKKKDM